jgi:hypothetical protein
MPRWRRCRGATRGGFDTSLAVPFSRDLQNRGTVIRSGAVGARQRLIPRRDLIATEKSNRGLLIGCQRERIIETRDCAGDEAGIVPPGQRSPRTRTLFEHVLHVRGRVELLIVVDSEIAFRLLEQDAADAGE